MAFTKSYISLEDQHGAEIQEYFRNISLIEDGEKKLLNVLNGEVLLWDILEGSEYPKSKERLKQFLKDEEKANRKYSILAYANALGKLQKRQALKSGAYGKQGLTIIPEREKKEETDKFLKIEEQTENVIEDDPNRVDFS
jgi:hypothetical protein